MASPSWRRRLRQTLPRRFGSALGRRRAPRGDAPVAPVAPHRPSRLVLVSGVCAALKAARVRRAQKVYLQYNHCTRDSYCARLAIHNTHDTRTSNAHAGSRGRGAARPGPRVREVRAARRIRSEVATPNVQRTVHETHIANVWLFTTTTDNTHETLGPGPAAAVRARGAANPKLQLRMFSITCACASPHLAQ